MTTKTGLPTITLARQPEFQFDKRQDGWKLLWDPKPQGDSSQLTLELRENAQARPKARAPSQPARCRVDAGQPREDPGRVAAVHLGVYGHRLAGFERQPRCGGAALHRRSVAPAFRLARRWLRCGRSSRPPPRVAHSSLILGDFDP